MGAKKISYNQNKFVGFVKVILRIILFPFVIIYVIKQKIENRRKEKINDEKIKLYNISQLDFLTGTEFELYLKSLFENMGYEVSLTKGSGDYGVDLILSKNGKKTIVQAKCYNHTVGVKAIQEVIGGREHYKIYDAMVVTNNYFSREAENLALENNVTLTDRIILEKMLKKYDVRIEKVGSHFSCMTPACREQILVKYKYWI